jgi:hypothetical protein
MADEGVTGSNPVYSMRVGRRTVDHRLTLGRGRFLVARLLVRAPSLPIIQSERARLAAS